MSAPSRDIQRYMRALEAEPSLLSAAEAMPQPDGRSYARNENPPPTALHRNAASAEGGGALVRDLETFLARYVILPEHTALPLALCVLLTFCFDSFDAVPYLVISSPTPRC